MDKYGDKLYVDGEETSVYDEHEQEIESEAEFQDIVLDYVEDEIVYFEEAVRRVTDLSEQYIFEEILDMNDLTPEEALAYLYIRGDIGLPAVIDETTEESEEVSGIPEEDPEEA